MFFSTKFKPSKVSICIYEYKKIYIKYVFLYSSPKTHNTASNCLQHSIKAIRFDKSFQGGKQVKTLIIVVKLSPRAELDRRNKKMAI